MESWHAMRVPRSVHSRPGATLSASFCHTRAALVAVCSDSGDVTLVDAAAPAAAPVTRVAACDAAVWDVAWRADDGLLALATTDGAVALLDAASGFGAVRALRHGDAPVRVVQFLGHDLIASAGRDGALKVWDLRGRGDAPVHAVARAHCAPGRQRAKSTPPSLCALAAVDERALVSAGQPELGLRVWDMRAGLGRPVRTIEPPSGKGRRPRAFLALASAFGEVHAVSADNRVYTYDIGGVGSNPVATHCAPAFRTNGSFYTRAALSPDGGRLAVGSAADAAYVFDVRPGGLPRGAPAVHALGEHRYEATCVAWSRRADGPEYVLVGGEDCVVRLWTDDRRSFAAHDPQLLVRPVVAAVSSGRLCESALTTAVSSELPPTYSGPAWPLLADYANVRRGVCTWPAGDAGMSGLALSASPQTPPGARGKRPAGPQSAPGGVRTRQLCLDAFLTPTRSSVASNIK